MSYYYVNYRRFLRKGGFTLVELSIVLVIIGLLIGGILVGQSIISATKINAFIRQFQQIDSAVANFRAKYKSLPGDSLLMPNPGNGDGFIAHAGGTNLYGYHFSSEISNFWPHLSISGFDPKHQYSATVTGSFNSNPSILNAPFALIGDKASALPMTDPSFLSATTNFKISNIQHITNVMTTVFPANPPYDINAIDYYESVAVDQKIDDGTTYTSLVQSRNYSTGTTGGNCLATHVNCVLFMRMLALTGGK